MKSLILSSRKQLGRMRGLDLRLVNPQQLLQANLCYTQVKAVWWQGLQGISSRP